MIKPNTLSKKISTSVDSAIDKFLSGTPMYLMDNGVSLFIDQNFTTGINPKKRGITSQSPSASILIKKKPFTTFKASNDLRWMDKTEKMLLRATKALFAYKVSQLRAYESTVKLDKFFEQYNEVNFNILLDLLNTAKYASAPIDSKQYIDILKTAVSSASLQEDVVKIMRRAALSNSNYLTTWIVDPDDQDNYEIGPGTGVIELCNFTSFNTSCSLSAQPSNASFSLIDPYRIMNIIEDDIEIAIEEALNSTIGIFNDVKNGYLSVESPLDTMSVAASLFNLGGLGDFQSVVDVDYIRERLRVFYLGKTIINVHDGVHFYLRSNTTSSETLLSDDRYNTSDFDESYLEIDQAILKAERNLYTDKKIDQKTYDRLRKYADNSLAMTHVFGGYITSVSESFSAGSNTMSIQCTDNMSWLRHSRYMESPSPLDPRGFLEDPLTPFDVKPDSSGDIDLSTGLKLLPENQTLLQSGLMVFDSGLLNANNANETNIYQGQYSGGGSLTGSKIIQHPAGMVYRWKTGIVAIASPFSDTLERNEIGSRKSILQNYGLTATESVVDNLDSANVISLLVSGQPYNMEVFTKLAFQAMNVIRKNGALNPTDGLSSVLSVIRRQNQFFGNFKPFRLITLSEQSINKLSTDYFALEDSKNVISALRIRKNKIDQKVRQLSKDTRNSNIVRSLSEESRNINLAIQEQVRLASNSTGTTAGELLNSNFNIFGQNRTLGATGDLESDHDVTRAMMIVASRRRFEDVKLNRDQNLLIISDQYDMNPELRAFNNTIRNVDIKLFKGTYFSPYERCVNAAEITGLEFFCNTQGHLELRPPQWNKTPLSVLNALFKYQKMTDKKVVPDFLFSMLQTRIASLRIEIHTLNVKIALLCLLLGFYPDYRILPGIPLTYNDHLSLKFFGLISSKFFGVGQGTPVLRNPGGVTNIDFNQLFNKNYEDLNKKLTNTSDDYLSFDFGDTKNGNVLIGNTTDKLGSFDAIFREGDASKKQSDSIIQFSYENSGSTPEEESVPAPTRYDALVQLTIGAIKGQSSISGGQRVFFTPENLNEIRNGFIKLTGLDPFSDLKLSESGFQKQDFVFNLNEEATLNGSLETKIDFYLEKIERAISQRDSMVDILNNNLQKQQELEDINQQFVSAFSETENTTLLEDLSGALDNNWWQNTLKTAVDITVKAKNVIQGTIDFLSGSANKGTLYDHLIDDDTRNLLGPGSGRRFIISDEKILDMSLSESPPDYVRVDIFGVVDFINGQIARATGGENLYTWGGATDFDTWRQYGWSEKTFNAPYISDSETQAKPLALAHLAVQRTKIFQGSITVPGNEYYQPGDSVYIASKGLMFYVTSVQHQFSFGSLKTSLQLNNGHPPGTYIPTTTDVIGQQYTKDIAKYGSYLVRRNREGDDSYRPLQPDCCIAFPSILGFSNENIGTSNLDILLSFRDNQVRFYNMINELADGILAGNRKLLIRGFVRNKNDPSEASDVKRKLDVISYLFQNPVMVTQVKDQELNIGGIPIIGGSPSTSIGDDFANGLLGTPLASVGGGFSSKNTTPLVLPNGTLVPKIMKEQILLQTVYLDRTILSDKENTSGIDCLGTDILTKNAENIFDLSSSDSISIGLDGLLGVLPKGGPSQSSWLDIRPDPINNIKHIVEIGILDIDSAIAQKLNKTGTTKVSAL